MTEEKAPARLSIVWSLDARADLRAIDRETALDILHCVDRYLATRNGDVKKAQAPADRFPPPLRRLSHLLCPAQRERPLRHRRQTPPRSLPLNTARTVPDNTEHSASCVRFRFDDEPGFGSRCASAQGMVSWPNTLPDAPRKPASAPELHASLPDLTALPMAGSRRPGHVEHEKNTFFS